jgi:hypothetical protein
MPPDLPNDEGELEKLVSDLTSLLVERRKRIPADMIECECGRSFPDYSMFAGCPYCGADLVQGDDEAGDEETKPKPKKSMSAKDIVVAKKKLGARERLEEIEGYIAKATTTGVRASWSCGRLLVEVREKKLYTSRGFKSFQQYLAERTFGLTWAYQAIGLFEACPEEALEMCEGMSMGKLVEFVRASKDAVANLADGAKAVHGVFCAVVGAAQEQKKLSGRVDAEKAVAAAKKDPEAAKTIERGRVAKTRVAQEGSPAAEETKKRGRPKNGKAEKSAKKVKGIQPVVPKTVPFKIDGFVSPRVLPYVHPKSGKKLARKQENLFGKCIHIPGQGGRFLRLVLRRDVVDVTVEKRPSK